MDQLLPTVIQQKLQQLNRTTGRQWAVNHYKDSKPGDKKYIVDVFGELIGSEHNQSWRFNLPYEVFLLESSASCDIINAANDPQIEPNKQYHFTNTDPVKKILIDIIFITNSQTFYALEHSDKQAIENAGMPLKQTISKLVNAINSKRNTRQQDIKSSKHQLQTLILPLINGPNSNSLTEIISFVGKKWLYLPNDDLPSSLHSYPLTRDIENRAKIMTHHKLDIEKLKHQLVKHETAFTWASNITQAHADELYQQHCDILNITNSHKKQIVNMSADARLMRYLFGTEISSNFYPHHRHVAFSIDAVAKFSLAQATLTSQVYLPSQQGWHVQLPTANRQRTIDLGYLRAGFEFNLSGFAGCSALANAKLHFSMGKTNKNAGKLFVKGINDIDKTISAQADAFAGIEMGCATCGNLAWDNPETREDDNKNFKEFANVGYQLAGDLGLGAQAGFYITFTNGKFRIRLNAGIVCGFGVNGVIDYTVDVHHLNEFVMFVYHKIKDYNFGYLGFIDKNAFNILSDILTFYAFFNVQLDQLAHTGIEQAITWYNGLKQNWHSPQLRQQYLEQLIQHLRSNAHKLKFTPPEVKGRLLYLLTEKASSTIEQSQRQIILKILDYLQSIKDYDQVLKYMSIDGHRTDQQHAEDRLQHFLADWSKNKFIVKLPNKALINTAVKRHT